MAHRVMPYYVREPQPWAIEQERRRHNQALWYFGEPVVFALMWHLEDHQKGLVGRCPTCYEAQGQIAEVYGQASHAKCLDCFGTSFEGGFKALIVRPAIFSDSDDNETKHSRGVVTPQDLTIESTPDFRVRTGDFALRINGDRFFLRVPERVTLRTGFAPPTQTDTAIGYNHANAVQEDPTSAAYLIPPANDELAVILGHISRIPRDWGTFEIIRAPLIPEEETPASLRWFPSTNTRGDNVPGPPGPPGTSGGSFTHAQMTPALVWMITHDLDYRPAGVITVDSAGSEVEGAVSYPADNIVRIDFAVPFSGTAYLS